MSSGYMQADKAKFCADCRWMKRDPELPSGRADQCTSPRRMACLVTGRTECHLERTRRGNCGPYGLLWEARDA